MSSTTAALSCLGFGHSFGSFEHHEAVGNVRRHRIGRDLRRADARKECLHFRHCLEGPLELELHLDGLREARARNAQRLHGEVALIQAGNELRAHSRRKPCARDDERPAMTHENRSTETQCPFQHWRVGATRTTHDDVFLLFDLAAQQERDRCGHKRQRQHERGEQRDDHGQRHRPKHLAFDAGQREDGQVHENHDQHADQTGREHFARRREHRSQPFLLTQQPPFPVLLLSQVAGCSSPR